MKDFKKFFSSLPKIPPQYWGLLTSLCLGKGYATITDNETFNRLLWNTRFDICSIFEKAGFESQHLNHYDDIIYNGEEGKQKYYEHMEKLYGTSSKQVEDKSQDEINKERGAIMAEQNTETKESNVRVSEPPKKKKIVLMPMDFSGTSDKLIINKGTENEVLLDISNLEAFMESTKDLEQRLQELDPEECEYEVRAYVVTGLSRQKALAQVAPLHQIAKRAGRPYLFSGVGYEYSGGLGKFNQNIPIDEDIHVDNPDHYTIEILVPNHDFLEDKRESINKILEEYPVLDENGEPIKFPVLNEKGKPVMITALDEDGNPVIDKDGNPVYQEKTELRYGKISEDAENVLNITFPMKPIAISKDQFDKAMKAVDDFLKATLTEEQYAMFNTTLYYDEYGIEGDIRPNENTKANSVIKILESLEKEGYEVSLILVCGDDQRTDTPMYIDNKEECEKRGISIYLLAPANIGELKPELANDPHVIKSEDENIMGIIRNIREEITPKIKFKSKGEGEFGWEIEQ